MKSPFPDEDHGHVLKEYMIAADTDAAQMGRRSYAVSLDADNLVLRFASDQDQQLFRKVVENVKHLRPKSVFSQRTEESSASQYFQFYGYLSQQQNMMQDYVRTSTYQRAILGNAVDFQDKIVLDVGAGSGILSFFAVQAGAAKVYAIEASNMAQYAQQLVESNNMQNKISVIPGKIEEIELPEKVEAAVPVAEQRALKASAPINPAAPFTSHFPVWWKIRISQIEKICASVCLHLLACVCVCVSVCVCV